MSCAPLGAKLQGSAVIFEAANLYETDFESASLIATDDTGEGIAAFYYDDLNRDSDGFVRPLANMNLGVDSQGNANPPTILKKFANAAGI